MATPNKETLLDWYHQMVLIRRFEERCAELYQQGLIGGFLHLYIGQEATGVGASPRCKSATTSSPLTAIMASRWRAGWTRSASWPRCWARSMA